MADRVIKFRGEFDASQILASLKQIRSEMEKSGASPDLFKSIDKDIEKAEGMVKELTVQINNGFKNTKELDAFGKKFDAFGKLCSKVELGLRDVNKAANFKISDSSLDQLKADLEEVQKKENDAAKASASAITNLKNITTKMRQELTQAADDGDKLEEVYTKLANQNFAKGQSTLNKVMANTGGLSNDQLREFGKNKKDMFTTADGGQKYAETLYKIATTSITVKEAFDELKQSLNEQDQEFIESDAFAESYIEDLKELANEAAKNKTQYKGSITKAINTMTTLGTAAPSGGFVTNSKETEQIADQMQLMQQKHALQEQISKKEEAMSAQAKATQDKFNTGLANATEQQKQLASATNQSVEATKQQVEAQKSLDQAFDKIGNIVKQVFSLSTAWRQVRRVITSTFQDVKQLDKSFGEIAMVTKYSVADMWSQYETYAAMANKLGQATKSVVDASALFYQQGLETNEVLQLTEDTMKLATLAGLDFKEATSQMTAALRAFHLEMDQGAHVTDVYAELAAHAAASVNDISQAMSATASIAHSAGMSFENTAAMLTTMIEATQEAPKNLGTAMKAILARFTELKDNVAGTAQSEFDDLDYNKVDKALKSVGITIKDANGQFRNMDDVLFELSGKWNSLDRNSQRYIATIAAGSRQQSRFIALMENYERTMQLVEVAEDSAGKSSEQFAKNQDTIEYKLNRMKNAWEQTRTSFLESGFYKDVIDNITGIISKVKNLNIGKLIGISAIGFTAGKSFIKNFIKGIKNTAKNVQDIGTNLKESFTKKFNQSKNKKENQLVLQAEVDLQLDEAKIKSIQQKMTDLSTKMASIGPESSDVDLIAVSKELYDSSELTYEQYSKLVTVIADETIPAEEKYKAVLEEANNSMLGHQNMIRGVTEDYDRHTKKLKAAKEASVATGRVISTAVVGAFNSLATSLGTLIATGGDLSVFFKSFAGTLGTVTTNMALNFGTKMLSMKSAGNDWATSFAAAGGKVGVTITTVMAGISALSFLIGSLIKKGPSLAEMVENIEKQEEALQSFISTQKSKKKETEEEIKSLEDLLKSYDDLNNKLVRTNEEEEEYKETIEKLKESYPELITFYDDENNTIKISNTLREEKIALLKEELELNRKLVGASEYEQIYLEGEKDKLVAASKLESYGLTQDQAMKYVENQSTALDLGTLYDQINKIKQNGLRVRDSNAETTDQNFLDNISELLGYEQLKGHEEEVNNFLTKLYGRKFNVTSESNVLKDFTEEELNQLPDLLSYIFEGTEKPQNAEGVKGWTGATQLRDIILEGSNPKEFEKTFNIAKQAVEDQYGDLKTANEKYIESLSRATAKQAKVDTSIVTEEDWKDAEGSIQNYNLLVNQARAFTNQSEALKGLNPAKALSEIYDAAEEANGDYEKFLKEIKSKDGGAAYLQFFEDDLLITDETAFKQYFTEGLDDDEVAKKLGELFANRVNSLKLTATNAPIDSAIQKSMVELLDNLDELTLEEYEERMSDLDNLPDTVDKENFKKGIEDITKDTVDKAEKAKEAKILTDNNIAMKAAADYFDMYGKYAESVGEQNAKDFVKTVQNTAKLYNSGSTASAAQNVIRNYKWDEVNDTNVKAKKLDFKKQMEAAQGKDYDATKAEEVFDSLINAAEKSSVKSFLADDATAQQAIDTLQKVNDAVIENRSKLESLKKQYNEDGFLTEETEKDLTDLIDKLNTAGLGLDIKDFEKKDEETGKLILDYQALEEAIGNYNKTLKEKTQLEIDAISASIANQKETLNHVQGPEAEGIQKQIDLLEEKKYQLEGIIEEIEKEEALNKQVTDEIKNQTEALKKLSSAYKSAITSALGNKGIISSSDFSSLQEALKAMRNSLGEQFNDDIMAYMNEEGRVDINKLKASYDQAYNDLMANNSISEDIKLQRKLEHDEFEKEYKELTDLTKAERENEEAELKLQQAKLNLAEAQKELTKKYKEYQEALHGSEDYRQPLDDLYNYTTALDRLSSAATRAKNALDNMMDGDDAKELLQQYYDSTREQIKFLEAENVVRKQAITNAQQTLQSDLNRELARNGMQGVDASQLYTNINDRYDLDLNKLNSLGINDSFRDFIANTVSSMNDLQKGIDENNDAIRSKQKEMLDYKKTINKNYVSLEDNMKNALKEKYQQEIDDLQAKYDAMESADSDYLDSLEEAINKQRELRDKANKWDDLATKEKKLSLMQRDTSGANALEVQKLEKEVQNDRQTLLDEGIDEVINNLKELYDLQKEERDLEIEYRESLLTDAQLLAEITEALEGIHTADDLVNWYTNITDWSGKSTANIEQMKTDWKDSFQALDTYRASSFIDFENAFIVTSQEVQETVKNTSETLTTKIKSELTTTSDAVEKAIKDAGKAVTDQQLSIINLQQSVVDLGKAAETAAEKLKIVQDILTGDTATDLGKLKGKELTSQELSDTFSLMGLKNNFGAEYSPTEKMNILAENGIHGYLTEDGMYYFYKDEAERQAREARDRANKSYRVFAKGGMVNYTGPAWVDGSPSAPEAFLNSEDTRRIGEAAKLLADLPALNGNISQNISTSTVGDTTIALTVNFDSISEEYDAERVIDLMKQKIVEAAHFAGSNVILQQ